MKVPCGMVIYDGKKRYKEGDEAPEKFNAVIERKISRDSEGKKTSKKPSQTASKGTN